MKANREIVEARCGLECPLTPTLAPSEGEREKMPSRLSESSCPSNSLKLPNSLPLPFGKGEGRGEGWPRKHSAPSNSLPARFHLLRQGQRYYPRPQSPQGRLSCSASRITHHISPA